MGEALEEGDDYFLILTWNKIDDNTTEIMYIRNNFLEEGNAIDTHMVKIE